MEQIAVVKITKHKQGETKRNMMLPKNIWEDIVSGNYNEKSVRWELRKVEPIVFKETKIINEEVREVELFAKPSPAAVDVSPAEKEEEDKPKRVYTKRK